MIQEVDGVFDHTVAHVAVIPETPKAEKRSPVCLCSAYIRRMAAAAEQPRL